MKTVEAVEEVVVVENVNNNNHPPASSDHSQNLFVDVTDVDMNGPVPQRPWKLVNP